MSTHHHGPSPAGNSKIIHATPVRKDVAYEPAADRGVLEVTLHLDGGGCASTTLVMSADDMARINAQLSHILNRRGSTPPRPPRAV